jgi:hypothetical protein
MNQHCSGCGRELPAGWSSCPHCWSARFQDAANAATSVGEYREPHNLRVELETKSTTALLSEIAKELNDENRKLRDQLKIAEQKIRALEAEAQKIEAQRRSRKRKKHD